ncbi:MAG: diguanylate cyclase, partial [Anaerolineaceae bacterium]
VHADGSSEDIYYPFLLPLSEETKITLQYRFPASAGDTLVIRRPSANALEVSVNGVRIERLGSLDAPTANLWNSIQIINLPDQLLDDNLLEIRLAGFSYDVGLSVAPYIDTFASASYKAGIGRMLYNDFLYISMGAALIIGLVLIILSFSREPKYRSEFFLGIASILAAFFCLDYTSRLIGGSMEAFFIMKKSLMVSGYVGALFFLIGMEFFAERKLRFSRVMVYVTGFSVALVMLAWNTVVLNRMLIFLNIVQLINITATVIVLVRHQNQKTWMIIPAVLLTLSMVQMVALTALNLSLPFVMQYIILVSAVVFGVSMISEYNQLYRENFELEEKANRDPLTGVFNRNILKKIIPHPQDALVIMDMDNLKVFNDKFGHQEGDRLLISLMDTVRENLRQSDLVIRYGGDEFVLLLRDSNLEVTDRIMQRIRRQFSHKKSTEWVSFSYGIARVGGSFSETLARADQMLYDMKNRKDAQPEPVTMAEV